MTTADDNAAKYLPRIHKAQPRPNERHCFVCGQPVHGVMGGNGPVWVHTDSGAVAAPDPPLPHRELIQNAERYRFIRAGLSEYHGDCYAMMFAEEGDVPISGDKLDAAVDAAMAKMRKGDQGPFARWSKDLPGLTP